MWRPVAWLVRTWTRCYTWGLPTDIRNRRRAEIDSALWEERHHSPSATPSFASASAALRLVLGIPADLAWRAERRRGPTRHSPALPHGLRVTPRSAAIGALGLILGAIWTMSLVYDQHNLEDYIGKATSSRFVLRAIGTWGLIHFTLPGVLLFPVVASSVAAMCGITRASAVLRIALGFCLLTFCLYVAFCYLLVPWLNPLGRSLNPFGGRPYLKTELILEIMLLGLLRARGLGQLTVQK